MKRCSVSKICPRRTAVQGTVCFFDGVLTSVPSLIFNIKFYGNNIFARKIARIFVFQVQMKMAIKCKFFTLRKENLPRAGMNRQAITF